MPRAADTVAVQAAIEQSSVIPAEERIFRSGLRRGPIRPWAVASVVLLAHAILRFAGLWRPSLIPLSMMLVWPMPWLLSDRHGRHAIGLRRTSLRWLVLGPLVGLIALATCALAAWLLFDDSETNWFFQHALALGRAAEGLPEGSSLAQAFWFLTAPAMVFSPLAEEILFRGYVLKAFSVGFGSAVGLAVQAAAFSMLHLAHYGLRPLQAELIPLWLTSMFGVALVLGWLVRRSGSLWPAIAAHAVFNLSMNALTFATFANLI